MSRTVGSTSMERAAASVAFHSAAREGLARFVRAATLVSCGSMSFRIWTRLRSAPGADAPPNPVKIGRWAQPAPGEIATVSPAAAMTPGIVVVAALGASAAGVPRVTDYVDIEMYPFVCEIRKALVSASRRTIFEGEVVTFDIAVLGKSVSESAGNWGCGPAPTCPARRYDNVSKRTALAP